jgi:hypothetical protein
VGRIIVVDWNSIMNALIGSGPVALILAAVWLKAEKRSDKWENAYIADAKEMLAAMKASEKALIALKEEIKS